MDLGSPYSQSLVFSISECEDGISRCLASASVFRNFKY